MNRDILSKKRKINYYPLMWVLMIISALALLSFFFRVFAISVDSKLINIKVIQLLDRNSLINTRPELKPLKIIAFISFILAISNVFMSLWQGGFLNAMNLKRINSIRYSISALIIMLLIKYATMSTAALNIQSTYLGALGINFVLYTFALIFNLYYGVSDKVEIINYKAACVVSMLIVFPMFMLSFLNIDGQGFTGNDIIMYSTSWTISNGPLEKLLKNNTAFKIVSQLYLWLYLFNVVASYFTAIANKSYKHFNLTRFTTSALISCGFILYCGIFLYTNIVGTLGAILIFAIYTLMAIYTFVIYGKLDTKIYDSKHDEMMYDDDDIYYDESRFEGFENVDGVIDSDLMIIKDKTKRKKKNVEWVMNYKDVEKLIKKEKLYQEKLEKKYVKSNQTVAKKAMPNVVKPNQKAENIFKTQNDTFKPKTEERQITNYNKKPSSYLKCLIPYIPQYLFENESPVESDVKIYYDKELMNSLAEKEVYEVTTIERYEKIEDTLTASKTPIFQHTVTEEDFLANFDNISMSEQNKEINLSQEFLDKEDYFNELNKSIALDTSNNEELETCVLSISPVVVREIYSEITTNESQITVDIDLIKELQEEINNVEVEKVKLEEDLDIKINEEMNFDDIENSFFSENVANDFESVDEIKSLESEIEEIQDNSIIEVADNEVIEDSIENAKKLKFEDLYIDDEYLTDEEIEQFNKEYEKAIELKDVEKVEEKEVFVEQDDFVIIKENDLESNFENLTSDINYNVDYDLSVANEIKIDNTFIENENIENDSAETNDFEVIEEEIQVEEEIQENIVETIELVENGEETTELLDNVESFINNKDNDLKAVEDTENIGAENIEVVNDTYQESEIYQELEYDDFDIDYNIDEYIEENNKQSYKSYKDTIDELDTYSDIEDFEYEEQFDLAEKIVAPKNENEQGVDYSKFTNKISFEKLNVEEINPLNIIDVIGDNFLSKLPYVLKKEFMGLFMEPGTLAISRLPQYIPHGDNSIFFSKIIKYMDVVSNKISVELAYILYKYIINLYSDDYEYLSYCNRMMINLSIVKSHKNLKGYDIAEEICIKEIKLTLKKDLEKALPVFSRLIYVYSKKGQYDDAMQLCETAIRLSDKETYRVQKNKLDKIKQRG